MSATRATRRGDGVMKCHSHASPLDLRFAVATSCNAYFCYVFRDILDNPKYGNVKEGYDAWKEYVESFGFGRKLGSDFLDERDGYVPDRGWYDRQYRGSWNSLTVISLAIGQDALGCTPLQLANLAAIVANRGYYIPHIVKKVEGRDSLDRRFYERHYTKVDPKHFEPIVEGMWRGVNVGGTSMLARLEGLDVCGKTGTAENPAGATTRPSCRSHRRTTRRSPFRSMSRTAGSAPRRRCPSPACWKSIT